MPAAYRREPQLITLFACDGGGGLISILFFFWNFLFSTIFQSISSKRREDVVGYISQRGADKRRDSGIKTATSHRIHARGSQTQQTPK